MRCGKEGNGSEDMERCVRTPSYDILYLDYYIFILTIIFLIDTSSFLFGFVCHRNAQIPSNLHQTNT